MHRQCLHARLQRLLVSFDMVTRMLPVSLALELALLHATVLPATTAGGSWSTTKGQPVTPSYTPSLTYVNGSVATIVNSSNPGSSARHACVHRHEVTHVCIGMKAGVTVSPGQRCSAWRDSPGQRGSVKCPVGACRQRGEPAWV